MVFTFEAESSEAELPIVTPTPSIERLDDELDSLGINYVQASNFDSDRSPINEIKAMPVSNNCESGSSSWVSDLFDQNTRERMKPLWIMATICRNHIRTGEPTPRDETLSEVRHRGQIGEDDRRRTHVIEQTLDGKVIDILLSARDISLNRGWNGVHVLSLIVESAIRLWVTTVPQKFNPHVVLQTLFYYGDGEFEDRPNHIKYLVEFQRNDGDEDNEDMSIQLLIKKMTVVAIENVQMGVEKLKEQIRSLVNQRFKRCIVVAEEFLTELEAILSNIILPVIKTTAKIRPKSQIRDRRISIWDFVPVVGSIKTVVEGVEDYQDGNVASCIANLALGVGCLALDICTLGSSAAVLKGTTQILAKEATKQATKEAAKQATKETTKQVTKQITRFTTKQVTKQITKQATQQIAKEATKQATKQIAKEATKQVTKQATKQLAKEATKQMTKQVTKQATKQITKQVTKEVTKQVTKHITKQATKQIAKEATKQVTKELFKKTSEAAVKTFALYGAASAVRIVSNPEIFSLSENDKSESKKSN